MKDCINEVVKYPAVLTGDEEAITNRNYQGPSHLLIDISVKPEDIHFKGKMFNKKIVACSVGIFVCYFYYGILQEKITRSTYGEEHEKFTYTISLVFLQCIVNVLVAWLVIRMARGDVRDDPTSNKLYATCAFSYLGAMVSSNWSLQHVSYPTQVVGKSCKPIPVMVLGVLLSRKSYPLQKYLFVLMIVAGVALFMYKDKAKDVVADPLDPHAFTRHIGEFLLLLSLSMDGVTGAMQERMRSSDKKASGNHMMFYMNLWSVLYLAVAEVATGEIFAFSAFAARHPVVLFNMVTFGLASALGQFFIFMTVAEFGPLVCSILTTTRKFFTVLFSVFFFGNSLAARQWLGTGLVFAGLSLDSVYGKGGGGGKHRAKHESDGDGGAAKHNGSGYHHKHHHKKHHPPHHRHASAEEKQAVD